VIEVRSRRVHGQGQISGALSIGASEIEARAAEIRKMGRLPILYCG
jgi:hypothetical protein